MLAKGIDIKRLILGIIFIKEISFAALTKKEIGAI